MSVSTLGAKCTTVQEHLDALARIAQRLGLPDNRAGI
ncbi:Uncharacterised protein [Mycobacteroides abscessus subsp. abscessus]|nr:Uncharacterised protein [Mycobacteroides abscessus subsp. abscessus]